MDGIVKILLNLGHKAIALVAITVSCLIAAAGFFWQQNATDDLFNQEQAKSQKSTVIALKEVVSSRTLVFQEKTKAISAMPALSTALANNDYAKIAELEGSLKASFPNAEKICLIDANVDDVGQYDCMAITFSVLSSLREAKEQGSSPLTVVKVGSENTSLLSAHSISNSANQVVGVLAVMFKPNMVTNALFNVPELDGYAELQQGDKSFTVMASKGDVQWKKNTAMIEKLSNTHWQVAYWPNTGTSAISSFIPMLVVLGALVLMWLFQKLLENFIFRRDIKIIKNQLIDAKLGELKSNYLVANGTLRDISDDIQDVTLSLSTVNAEALKELEGKLSTSEQVSQKLAEQKPKQATLDEDMFEDADSLKMDIDPSIFKPYDIRGIVNQALTEDAVKAIGQAIGSEAQYKNITSLVVGRDGRNSSPSLSEALIEGILASGCDVVNIGMVPTPLVYFAAEHAEFKSGVMVTGSHNPANYNGLKIVLAGKSLTSEQLQSLYQKIKAGKLKSGQGSRREQDVIDQYIERITDDVKLSRSIKVVIDCGNGVAGVIAPKLFKALGCEVIELYCDVDGRFPNHQPDPSQPDNMKALVAEVKSKGAELGIAFDGDGDRLGVVDINGNIIWPDRLMVMFSQDVLLRMPGSVVIYDVKSSNVLGEEVSRAGGEAIMWQSGYTRIKEKMQETGAQLAGEMSGHIFFKERWFGFDDALYAASRLFELLCNDPLGRTPTDIFAALPSRVSTPELLVEMEEAECKTFMVQFTKDAEFTGAEITTIDGVRADYPNGWGLVRASNTMPSLTLRFEADTLEDLQHIQQRFRSQMLKVKPTLSLTFPTLDK